MVTATQLAADDPALLERVRRARTLLGKRALMAAAASAVPVPGLDWAVDAALLSRLVPLINAEFGLTPAQLDQLQDNTREQVQKAASVIGSVLIGKFITRDLVLRFAARAGLRMTAKRAAKYVPLAGQAVSALMGYAAIRYLGEQHIKDCVQVAMTTRLRLPAPAPR